MLESAEAPFRLLAPFALSIVIEMTCFLGQALNVIMELYLNWAYCSACAA